MKDMFEIKAITIINRYGKMHACSQRLSLNFKLETIWVTNGFCNSSVGLLQSSYIPLSSALMVRSSQSLSEESTICTLLRGFGWISPHPRLWFATETPEYGSNCGQLEMGLGWFENQSSTLHSRAFALCDVIALLHNGHSRYLGR